MNLFWGVVSAFRAYEHFCNFYLFRNYQINRTLVKRFLGKKRILMTVPLENLKMSERMWLILP